MTKFQEAAPVRESDLASAVRLREFFFPPKLAYGTPVIEKNNDKTK